MTVWTTEAFCEAVPGLTGAERASDLDVRWQHKRQTAGLTLDLFVQALQETILVFHCEHVQCLL